MKPKSKAVFVRSQFQAFHASKPQKPRKVANYLTILGNLPNKIDKDKQDELQKNVARAKLKLKLKKHQRVRAKAKVKKKLKTKKKAQKEIRDKSPDVSENADKALSKTHLELLETKSIEEVSQDF